MARRYALVIGISEYNSPLANLTKTVTDAKAVADLLRQHGNLQQPPAVLTGRLTKTQLEQAIERLLLEQAVNNEALIYFTGHGLIVKDLGAFLVTSDSRLEQQGGEITTLGNCLPLTTLDRLIKQSNFSNLMVLLDCCHSGRFLERTVTEGLNAFSPQKDYYFITACRGFETARARKSEQHSVFTGALLEALSPQNASETGDITGHRLFDLLSDALKGSGQEPISIGYGRSITIVTYPIQPAAAVASFNPANPYVGLQAFQFEQAAYFYGRSPDIRELLARLDPSQTPSRRFLAVIGPSGSGKSSLVRAGLLPELQKDGLPGSSQWQLDVITPGQYPKAALTEAIARHADLQPYVLFIDQFEELFTLCPREEEQREFLALLNQEATDPNRETRVVIAMRGDFLDHCARYQESADLINQTQPTTFIVTPLTDAQFAARLEEVIVKPAAMHGVSFAPGLVSQIISEVLNQLGAMPLLQFALTELWETCIPDSHASPQLTWEGYRTIGGVKGALQRRADLFYQGLTQSDRAFLPQLLLQLVQIGDEGELTRRHAHWEDLRQLASHEQLDRIIRQLTDQRFLVAGEQTIEVAHESLLTEVPLIRNWIEENRERIRLRDRFERNCREWHEQGKSPDYLLNRGRLAAVEEWIAKDQPALSDKETEFLRQSRELRDRETQAQLEQERRLREEAEARARAEAEKAAIEGEKTQLAIAAARKLKARAVGLGILLITSLGAFLLAFWQYRNAVQQSELNDARRLEVLAQEALSQSPMQALLLSLEVAGRGFKTESSSVLWQALKEVKEEAYLLGHVDNVVEGEFSKNGEYVLTVGDQTAKLWNLKNLAAPITLNAHKNLVLHGEFSPNNQKILTIGFKEKAIIWNRQNLSQPAAILPVPNGKLNHGSFSQDGRKVITVGDGFVIVWTLDELGKPIQQKSVSGVDGKIVKGVFSPVDSNEILIADAAGEVHFINLENPTEARSFAHKDYVQSAIFNQAKPNLILTASYDNTAKVWDLSQPGNQAIATLKHDGYVREAAFDPKNPNRIVTVSADKTARIWDISDRLKIQPLYTLKGHGDTLRHGEFSPHNSKIILTTSEDGTARVWNLEKPDTPTVLRGHVGQVYSGKFHPQDPNRILTTGQDDIARIWNLQPFNNPQVLSGHSGAVSLAVFDPKDTSRILTVSEDLTARVWNLKKAGEVIVLKGHQEEIEWGSFSPQNPNLVLTASLDGTARLWSLKTQTAIELKHNKDVVKASFSPKGDKIVTASYDYTAKLWEVDAAGKVTQLGKPLQHKDTVEHAAFSQQGNLVVTTSRDTTAKVWNLRQTEQAIATLKHDDIIIYAEFDPNDENRVLTVGFDRTAKLWDLRSPDREIARLTGHQGPIVYANFSQDSKQVLTVSRDGTARVWNLAARNSIELKGHKSAINYGMFHPQNHHLVITASSDRTVRLWDVRDPEHPIVLSGHTAPVKTAIFSPTENPLQILTASQDGKAAVYTIPSWEQIVNAAWQRATRCLSQEEKRNFVLSSEQNIPQQSLLSQFLNLTMQKPYPNCK